MRNKSNNLLIFTLLLGINAFCFGEDAQLTSDQEKALIVSPKVWVDVHQSNGRPVLPRIAGEYVFSSTLNERDKRLGCIGKNLYALHIGDKSTKDREEKLIANYDCVIQLQTFGDTLFIIHRYTPKKEDGKEDSKPAVELRIDSISVEKGLDPKTLQQALYRETIGKRGEALHQVRFAVKMDALGLPRNTKATRIALLNKKELFVIADVGEGDDRKSILDILPIEKPWDQDSEPVIDIPIKNKPVADFLVPSADELIVATDGGRRELANIYFFKWDGKKLQADKTLGTQKRLPPSWTEEKEEDFAVRRPRFLTLLEHGLLGSEKSSREQQFVFYLSSEDKKAYKVTHLSKFLDQVAGFHFVSYKGKPGLLVADSDRRWIRLYANESTLPKDMEVHRLDGGRGGEKLIPVEPKEQPKTQIPDTDTKQNKKPVIPEVLPKKGLNGGN